MNELEKILNTDFKSLQIVIAGKFTSYPSKVCDCGKPVVFIYPSLKHKCSRCNKKWQLFIEVREVISTSKPHSK